MKINILNTPINKNPETLIHVSKEEFFKYFFRMYYMKDHKTLSDNEIKVMAALCAGLDISQSGIKPNNLPPVIKKLNQKFLMDGKELSAVCKSYVDAFKGSMSILFNFVIDEG